MRDRRPRSERRRQQGGTVECTRAARACSWGLFLSSSLIPHPSSLAWAAHPFLTDDTGTQGAGNWQLELQAERNQLDRTADTGAGPVEQIRKITVFTPVLTYGLLENVDVALGLNHLRQRFTENGVVTEDADGMADSTLELKWRFYEAEGLSLALKPGLLLPTGNENRGLGTGEPSWGVNFIATYEAKPWTFSGNAAYSHVRYKLQQDADENRADLWRVSGGLAYAVRDESAPGGRGGGAHQRVAERPVLARQQWPVRHAGSNLFAHR